jgi:hypothetical protein
MSTVFSHNPTALGLGANCIGAAPDAALHSGRFNGSRGLAALMLAAVVATMVVLADQLISSWTDQHLLFGWTVLWLVTLAGTVLFAAPARRLARRALPVLRSWTQALAEAREEQRLWHAAHRDPRLMADLMHARRRDLDEARSDRQPWGRFPERLRDGRGQQIHLNHP